MSGADSGSRDPAGVEAVPGLVPPPEGSEGAVLGRVDLRAWARALGVRDLVGVDEELTRPHVLLRDVLADLVAVLDQLLDTPEPDIGADIRRAFDVLAVPAARLDVVRRTAREASEHTR